VNTFLNMTGLLWVATALRRAFSGDFEGFESAVILSLLFMLLGREQ